MTTKAKQSKRNYRISAEMWGVIDASGIRSVERSRRLARDFARDMDTPCRVVRVLVREV